MEPNILWTPTPKQIEALERPEGEVLFGGSRGGGKVQPLDSKVLTPFGWREMGELVVGDTITSMSGSTQKVIGVYEQGEIDSYEVTFDDGSKCEVGLDHLWLVKRTSHAKPKGDRTFEGYFADGEVWTTQMMMAWLESKDSGDAKHKQVQHLIVPVVKPVKFSKAYKFNPMKLPPYVVGVLIGDGCPKYATAGAVKFTGHDPGVADKIRSLGYHVDDVCEDGKTWTIRDDLMGKRIDDLGMRKVAGEKSIPYWYLFASLEQRLDLMAGLIDTDGYVDDRGHISYTTISEALAKDVQTLAWGLGCAASITTKTPVCTNSPDGPKECKLAYTVWIRPAHGSDGFCTLPRKVERLKGGSNFNGGLSERGRRVVSIAFKRRTLGRCIAVSDPARCYITNDFIVTHNTDAGIAWLLQWVENPLFRALVIRLQSKDLADWTDRADRLYSALGAEMVGRPPVFRWPSGALIYTGHLQDDRSWQLYQGHEYQKLLIEELTQIPNEERYEKLLGSMRSTVPGIFRQVFSTANPGGPGTGWVKKRFINVKDYRGVTVEHGRPILLDKAGKKSRIYVPSTIDDNPHLALADPDYVEWLESLPENLRKAWRYGDWDCLSGQYFTEFRKLRMPHEPQEALHVIPSFKIPKGCHRWLGWDWGYSHESAVYWFARTPDSRVHVYRELVAKQVSAEEFGYRVATASLEDLEDCESMTIHLSQDAFHKRDARNTIAEQIASGIGMVLGHGAVFMAEYDDREKEMAPVDAMESLNRRREARKGKYKIAVERATNDRINGWQYVRSMLRWKSIGSSSKRQPDLKFVTELLKQPDAAKRFADYMESFTAATSEVLPRVLIHDRCSQLPDCILAAQHDESNPEDVKKQSGDDQIEAFRYGLFANRKIDAVMSHSEYIENRVLGMNRSYGRLSPDSDHMIRLKAESEAKRLSTAQWVTPRRRVG